MTTQAIARASRAMNLRCHAGNLAILSTRFGARVVRVKGRAADICYDWKVEVLGSPVWCVDARSDVPALTNLGLVKDAQLFPLEMDDMELSLADAQDR
ncbi:hypothetical protein [Paraburkholderia heleia]|uniref:hypothetical protein n=1 Tax=Paraburkholderia heleia TaxID=634127 RepID=UPI002AB5F043|nr:hypothetical protein [Paraburkholderia heleia]